MQRSLPKADIRGRALASCNLVIRHMRTTVPSEGLHSNVRSVCFRKDPNIGALDVFRLRPDSRKMLSCSH